MTRNRWRLFVCLLFFWPLSARAEDNQTVVITVMKDDTLLNLCKHHLEDPRRCHEISQINLLPDPDRIFPGQKLVIPVRLLKGIPLDGSVTFIKGTVSIQSKEGKAWQPLHLNERIKPGSKIKTGEESAVEIAFEEGPSFYLKSDTLLQVRNSERKGVFLFIRKFFLSLGRAVTNLREATGNESDFEMETPSAVVAPRGTEFRVSVDSDRSTRSEVLTGHVAVGAMGEEVDLRENEGTLVKEGAPPMKPVKLLPPPAPMELQPEYRDLPLRFHFEQIEGAVSYRHLLAREREVKDPVAEKILLPGDPFEIPSIEDGIYYLQSQSIDRIGLESLPSEPAEIKVRIHPIAPVIASPIEGEIFRKRSVRLQWSPVKAAAGYRIQIAEDASFNRIEVDKNELNGLEEEIELPGFTDYYFRIRAVAKDGYEGGWSKTRRFSLKAPPAAPTLEKPQVGKKEIQMKWRSLDSGFTYHVQMARDARFGEILVDQKTDQPEIALQRPDADGRYYLRLRAVDSDGTEGAFSTPQSFDLARQDACKTVGLVGAGVLLLLVLLL